MCSAAARLPLRGNRSFDAGASRPLPVAILSSNVHGVTFLAKLLLGDGKLDPKVRAALESEGLVLVEEGLRGSVRYRRFRAPGRRHHGKVTGERIALAISAERLVVYCRSGSTALIDSSFTNPRWSAMDVALEGTDSVSIRIDYDRAGLPNISGEITIVARTPKAATIVDQLRTRLGR